MPDFLRLRRFSFFFAVALLGMLLLAAPGAHAQGKRKVMQFTGIVATGDSLLGVPGRHRVRAQGRAGARPPTSTATSRWPCWPATAS